jgi:hypothetical protein
MLFLDPVFFTSRILDLESRIQQQKEEGKKLPVGLPFYSHELNKKKWEEKNLTSRVRRKRFESVDQEVKYLF